MNTRNRIIVVVLLFSLVSISEASIFSAIGGLLGIGSKGGDFKAGINDVKAGINDVQTKLDDVKVGINDVQAKIDLQSQVNAKAFVGLQDKSETVTAGRDVIQTTTNDSDLMMAIIKGLLGLCTTLIGIIGWSLKTLLKRDKEKKFYKEQTLLHTQSEADLLKLRELHDGYVKKKRGKKI